MQKHQGKSIDFFSLVCLVIANMIGSGLYTSSGFALKSLGRADLVMVVWGIAGVMAICGAIAYGAIARRLPDSGGEYLYLSRLLHPSIGFLAGWISLVAGFTAPIAAAALVFAVYAEASLPTQSLFDHKAIASTTILLAAILHASRLKTGLWMQNLAVVVKVVGLGSLIVWGFFFSSPNSFEDGIVNATEQGSLPFQDVAMLMVSSLVWISLAYTGFNAAIYVAGESKNAAKIVPQSMLAATVVVTLIYLALNYLFLYGADPNFIAGEPRIAEVSAIAIGGVGMGRLMLITILLSSWTSVLSLLMTGPRVYAKMAEDRLLPQLFQMSSNVPRWAIFVQAILSIIVVYISNLRDLIGYLGLTLTACGAITIASLFRLSKVFPNATSLTWYEKCAASIFITLTICMITAAYSIQRIQFLTMLATFVSGFILYLIARRFNLAAINPADLS